MSQPSTTGVFDLSKARIVELALTDVSAMGPGRRPTPEQRFHAGMKFSELVASLSTSGIMRFLFERRELTLVAGTSTYTLPDDVWDVNDPVNYRTSSSDTVRRPLWPLSIEDYMLLGNRDVQSSPSQYVIEKAIGTAGEVAKLTTYPVPDTDGALIEYPAILKVRDMTTDANTPSFPAKWLRCIQYGLALDLSAAYKVPDNRVQFFMRQFETLKNECLADDHERVNLQVVPYLNYGGGDGGSWY